MILQGSRQLKKKSIKEFDTNIPVNEWTTTTVKNV